MDRLPKTYSRLSTARMITKSVLARRAQRCCGTKGERKLRKEKMEKSTHSEIPALKPL